MARNGPGPHAAAPRRLRAAVAAGALCGAASLAAVPAAAAAAAAAAPSAPASPDPILPAGAVPGGFAHVVATVPVTAKGRVIAGRSNGVAGKLVVAPGSLASGTDVLITTPHLAKIPHAKLRVPAKQAALRPIYGLGVLFQQAGHRAVNKKLVTLTFSSKRFTRQDYVVIYYAAQHAFVPAPKRHARCTPGVCVVKFTAGTEVLVLGP